MALPTAVTGSTAVTAGTASTATVSVTPTLPAAAAAGDRIFIWSASVGAVSTPTSWNSLFNGALGGGSAGSGTGTRNCAVFWRDYDGSWTMPTLTAASAASNSIAAAACGVHRLQTDLAFADIVSSSGSMSTASTSMSVTGSSVSAPGNAALMFFDFFPKATVESSLSFSNCGVTSGAGFGTFSQGGTATGNGAAIEGWGILVVGSTAAAAPGRTATLSVSATAGTVFMWQPVISNGDFYPRSRARFRAALW